MSMNVQVNKDADDYCHLNTLNYSASATDGTMHCALPPLFDPTSYFSRIVLRYLF